MTLSINVYHRKQWNSPRNPSDDPCTVEIRVPIEKSIKDNYSTTYHRGAAVTDCAGFSFEGFMLSHRTDGVALIGIREVIKRTSCFQKIIYVRVDLPLMTVHGK